MRPGGEAGKFGNDYETSWTVFNLLRLLDDQAVAFEPEPMTDPKGIEFIATKANGIREFHSVKIQTTGPYWSLADLMRETNDRSIAGDLFAKLAKEPTAEAWFVSEVGANPLQLFCEKARLAGSSTDFQARLSADQDGEYQKHLAKHFTDIGQAHDRLQRLHAISMEQSLLEMQIERSAATLVRRSDNASLAPGEVRRLLHDIILEFLGRKIDRATLLARIKTDGYELADFARNPRVLDRIAERNRAYKLGASKFLINDRMIRRPEAFDAFEQLQAGSVKFGAFVGVAGMGKSCAIAELFDYLEKGNVPTLVLRLDHLMAATW